MTTEHTPATPLHKLTDWLPATTQVELDALRAEKAELVAALRELMPLLDQVPVFQLDDGKSSVKAVRLAGKFMDATKNARALLAKVKP